MAQQNINIGSSANKGDGDPLRTAFTKINSNFTELYGKVIVLEGGGVAIQRDTQGSIFGDDSTLLVDAVNSLIPSSVLSGNLPALDGSALTNLTIPAQTFASLTGTPTTLAGYGITDAQVAGALTDGDIKGSVFGDDSTLLVDGNNNKIVGPVDTASLRTSESKIALGFTAGESNQGTKAIAIGEFAGMTDQGTSSIAIGKQAGETTQGAVAVAIGDQAGMTTQGDRAIAIGQNAGFTTQSSSAVALGDQAGLTNQGTESVAIGLLAGKLNQGAQTIAIGSEAGRDDQSANGIALGHEAGRADQADFGIAIGEKSGNSNQGIRGIAIGRSSGKTDQGTKAVAIGDAAGYATQGAGAIAIGDLAGETNQAANSIVINASGTALNNTTASSLKIKPIRNAVGTTMLMYDATSGEVTHTASPVITGDITGSVFGDDSTVLVDAVNAKVVGNIDTASLRTSERAVILGSGAGQSSGSYSVAIGYDAGQTGQGSMAVAIGNSAGYSNQGQAIAIGQNAGQTNQSVEAIGIGWQAGKTSQGAQAIAIGAGAGQENQAANSIVINATGSTVQNTQASSLVIKPIRNAVGTTMLMYDAGTGEVTHSGNVTLGGDLDVGGNSIVSASNGAINIAPDGTGTIDLSGQVKFAEGMIEKFATTNGATGVTALDCSTGNVHYLTAYGGLPAGNITANFTNLNLTAEYATNVTVVIDQGGTEREITAVQIGGVAQTIVWQGNSAPTGTANGVDSFSFTILNDGGTYVVLGQMVAFGGV